MCGIIGFTGSKKAAPVLVGALSKLEYRGYDSAGVATVCSGKLHVEKGTGKLEEVQKSCNFDALPGNTGIGHVRWATHGEVSRDNAHPHWDCNRRIALVHNGIIENHEELRQRLNKNHVFRSDTDSEVVIHLVEEYLQPGMPLEKAVCKAAKELTGSFALVFSDTLEPGKVVACRNGSPLVVGVGKGESFIASDFQAFIETTRQVIYVEDRECVILTRVMCKFLMVKAKKSNALL